MRILIFDCETNGLLDTLDRVHSLVIKDAETGEVKSCCHPFPDSDLTHYCDIEYGLMCLMEADLVVGHNIIKFDIPALKKVYPWFDIPVEKIRDTLVLSRLLWADVGEVDAKRIHKGFPKKLIGSHSLEAWGFRLGVLKGDFGKTSDWSVWTPEMQDYCEQDVEVTEVLWQRILSKEPPERAVELETWFAHIIAKQERFGYAFDKEKAVALYLKLLARRQELDEELKAFFKPWFVGQGKFIPKGNNKKTGYTKGVPLTKVKLIEFNPGSRQQIADRLTKLYGWKPKEFTESGQPKIDETILNALKYPPAKLLSERFMLDKRIGQLAEGDNAWLKLEKNGRIHGSVNTIGAVTGRCTHSYPNVAQVPSVRAPYGPECRELYHAPPGFKQVGADASGLELRCLAHYMARYDGGAYAKILLEGDVHTANQEAAGLPTRDNAKTFIYAFLYGAGDEKIGEIIGKGAAAGKKLKENFLKRTPALKRLKDQVAHTVKTKGFIRGIDGRKLRVRSEHAALNTLLQSAGALLVKQATVNLYRELTRRGYVWGRDWAMVAHVHDEYQLHVLEHLAQEVAEVAVWSFQQAGRDFGWRCPLDGEAKIGANWRECH
jgi:hypothetical protein